MVVPALAVESQDSNTKRVNINDVLPNCLPLWYWFGELFIPGFIGDRCDDVVSVALNLRKEQLNMEFPFEVKLSIEFAFGNG